MKSENEKILIKIKKLLALAESSNVNEAATAAKMASKMMTEYQIEMADVIKIELNKGECLSEEDLSEQAYSLWPKWMQFLSVHTAQLFDCQIKFERVGRKMKIIIQGYEADVQMVKWMYDFLYLELKRQVGVAFKNRLDKSVSARDFKGTFLFSAVNVIGDRMEEIIEKNKIKHDQEVAGTSLMVIKKDAIAKRFGTVEYKSSSTFVRNEEAHSKGTRAGQNVNLNRPLGKGESAKRLN